MSQHKTELPSAQGREAHVRTVMIQCLFVFPTVFDTSPVLFPPNAPHLVLVWSLVCLSIVFVLPLVFVSSFSDVLFPVTPSWSVVPCVSYLVCFWFLTSCFDMNFAFLLLLCIWSVCLGSLRDNLFCQRVSGVNRANPLVSSVSLICPLCLSSR